MNTSILSTANCWPGTVYLPEALNFPQYIAWQDALEEAGRIRASLAATTAQTGEASPITVGELALDERLAQAMLLGILACVTKW